MKIKKLLIIFIISISIFATYKVFKWLTHSGVPIYMYHGVSSQLFDKNSNEEWFVEPSEFEKHLKFLTENNYTSIFASDLSKAHNYKKPVIITFDDGYLDNYTDAYPLLKKYNMKATIFVVSDKINTANYLTDKNLKEMSSSNLISIQSHTKTHPKLTDISLEQLEYELKYSKQALQEIVNKDVNVLAYPYGATNETVIKEASKYYDTAFVTFGCKNYKKRIKMKMPRAGIFRHTSFDEFKSITKNRSKTRFQNLFRNGEDNNGK